LYELFISPPMSSSSILLFELYFVRGTSYEDPQQTYTISCSLLSLHPTWVQIFFFST
jgi:hypothetical protein